MSTTYAIPAPEIEDGFVIIGHTSNFEYQMRGIQKHFKDDTPIVAIDNDTKITNIKELREHYNKQNNG